MPFMIAAAIGGSALIGAYGANKAANTQAGAQTQAAQTQMDMFNAIKQQQQPFVQLGYQASSKLSDLMGLSGNGDGSLLANFTPADYLANKDPGYQFQLDQGASAVRNAATPTAGALSGSTLKDLMNFNQNTAATGYQNAFNRFQTQTGNIFQRLSAIAGLGQNAAANTGTAGTQLGIGAAQAGAAAGASQAAGTVGVANSLSGAGIPLAYLMANQSGGGGGGAANVGGTVPGGYIDPYGTQFNNPSAYHP